MQLQHAQADFGETDFYRAGRLCRRESFRCKKNAGRLFEAETVEYVCRRSQKSFEFIGRALSNHDI